MTVDDAVALELLDLVDVATLVNDRLEVLVVVLGELGLLLAQDGVRAGLGVVAVRRSRTLLEGRAAVEAGRLVLDRGEAGRGGRGGGGLVDLASRGGGDGRGGGGRVGVGGRGGGGSGGGSAGRKARRPGRARVDLVGERAGRAGLVDLGRGRCGRAAVMRSARPTGSSCARRGSSSSCGSSSRRRRVPGRVLRRPAARAGAPGRRGRGARADGVSLAALVGRRLVDREEARRRRLVLVREQAHGAGAK